MSTVMSYDMSCYVTCHVPHAMSCHLSCGDTCHVILSCHVNFHVMSPAMFYHMQCCVTCIVTSPAMSPIRLFKIVSPAMSHIMSAVVLRHLLCHLACNLMSDHFHVMSHVTWPDRRHDMPGDMTGQVRIDKCDNMTGDMPWQVAPYDRWTHMTGDMPWQEIHDR